MKLKDVFNQAPLIIKCCSFITLTFVCTSMALFPVMALVLLGSITLLVAISATGIYFINALGD